MMGPGGTQAAVFAGKAEAPLPLLADDLYFGRIVGDRDELVPDEQARRQHGRDAHAGPDAQPPFQLLVFRLVGRAYARPVTEAENAKRHEQDDGEEDDGGDPAGEDE